MMCKKWFLLLGRLRPSELIYKVCQGFRLLQINSFQSVQKSLRGEKETSVVSNIIKLLATVRHV